MLCCLSALVPALALLCLRGCFFTLFYFHSILQAFVEIRKDGPVIKLAVAPLTVCSLLLEPPTVDFNKQNIKNATINRPYRIQQKAILFLPSFSSYLFPRQQVAGRMDDKMKKFMYKNNEYIA